MSNRKGKSLRMYTCPSRQSIKNYKTEPKVPGKIFVCKSKEFSSNIDIVLYGFVLMLAMMVILLIVKGFLE